MGNECLNDDDILFLSEHVYEGDTGDMLRHYRSALHKANLRRNKRLVDKLNRDIPNIERVHNAKADKKETN